MTRQEGAAQQVTHSLTPRLRDGTRICMELSTADYAKARLRRLGYWGVVTDQATGKRYALRGASCNLPYCNCDAVATEIAHGSGNKGVV